MTTQLEERPASTGTDGPDDLEAHLVSKRDWGEGYILGREVEALCGKRWVPSLDPEGRELCAACAEVLSRHGTEAS